MGPLGLDGCWQGGDPKWTRIDLGEPMLVAGVLVRNGAGHAGTQELPARARFEVSANFSTWTDVDGGAWIAQAAANEMDANYVFASPTMARYVRAHFDGGYCFSLALLTRGSLAQAWEFYLESLVPSRMEFQCN